MEHFRNWPKEDACLLFNVRNKYTQVSYADLFVAVNSGIQKEKASFVRIEQKNVFIIICDMYKLYISYCKIIGQSVQCKLIQSIF